MSSIEFRLDRNDPVDEMLEQFEQQWEVGDPPTISDFLTQNCPQRAEVLWELIATDLEIRIKRGQQPCVESYVESFPELAEDSGRLAELVMAEYELRSRREPGLDFAEFRDRFPHLDWSDLQPADETTIENRNVDKGRYRLLRPHDEGGLGKVWIASDEDLQRYVALKEIKSRFADDEVSRRRFEQEAMVTARLQHPGIAPVYNRGQHVDGRPFYTMRLIEGGTLQDAISEFHSPANAATDSADIAADRVIQNRRLLSRLIEVCYTIDYAHRNGILHRDIKPSNIMLANEGGTFVIDWGLSKVIGDPESHNLADPNEFGSSSTANVEAEDHGDLSTKLGSMLGSPAYMSPEQARGDHDQLDARSDVYSLGATLFTILTNQAPFAGERASSVFGSVVAGAECAPRRIDADIPKPLDSICRKAMAGQIDERYDSALSLAHDLERYLADEKPLAHVDSISDGVGRATRRHQKAIRSLAVASIVFSLVVAGWAVHANRLRKQAQDFAQLESSSRQSADQAVDLMLEVIQSPTRIGKDVTMLEVLSDAEDRIAKWSDPNQKSKVLTVIAKTYRDLGLFEASVRCTEGLVNLHKDTDQIDSDELWEAQFILAESLTAIGEAERAMELHQSIIKARRDRFGEHHSSVLQSMHAIGQTHCKLDSHLGAAQYDQAIAVLRETHRLRIKTLGESHLDTLHTQIELGSALADNGSGEEGTQLVLDAIELIKTLDISERAVLKLRLQANGNLISTRRAQGQHAIAVSLLTPHLDELRKFYGAENAVTLKALGLLAHSECMLGDFEKSIAHFEQYRIHCGDWTNVNTLAAMDWLAQLHLATGNAARAIKVQEQIVEQADKHWPKSKPYRHLATLPLAQAYLAIGDFDRAVVLAGSTCKYVKSLPTGSPYRDKFGNYALIYVRALIESGQLDKAQEIADQILADCEPGESGESEIEGFSYGWKGESLLRQAKYREAKMQLTKAASSLESFPHLTFVRGHFELLHAVADARAFEESDREVDPSIEKRIAAAYDAMEESLLTVGDRSFIYLIVDDAQRVQEFFQNRNAEKQSAEWSREVIEKQALLKQLIIRPTP